VPLAEFGFLWPFMRVGQGYRDEPPLGRPEGASVDARQTSEEICAAFPGEAPYSISDAPTTTLTRTEPITCLGILEGKCRYRPSYGGGYVGNPLM
jgi:hypothetical protein